MQGVSVKQPTPQQPTQNAFTASLTPEQLEMLKVQERFDEDIKEIIEFIKTSDMQSLKIDPDNGTAELDLDTLRNWKSKYGKIYASRVTEDPVIYIWRPLLRMEYRSMMGNASTPGTVNWKDDFLRQDAILKKCLLFPSPTFEFLNGGRAGVASTLEEQILYQSGFMGLDLAVNRIQPIG